MCFSDSLYKINKLLISLVLQDIPKALDDSISSTNTVVLRPPSSPFPDTNPLNMTIVSNDPIWWPVISYFRVYSYFSGSWKASGLIHNLTMVFQLYPSLRCYTIGVSHAMLMRKTLMSLPLQR
jgi:hypothetical protein